MRRFPAEEQEHRWTLIPWPVTESTAARAAHVPSTWTHFVNALHFKSTIRLEDRAAISTWLGDSQVWMRIAVERARSADHGLGGANHNELNVAHVCTGLAFELAMKALAKSEGRSVVLKHEATKIYRSLSQHSRTRIEQAAETDLDGLLRYLDREMCHPDRKYWMMDRRGRHQATGFSLSPAIPTLAALHAKIIDIAGEITFENWQEGLQVRI